MSEYVAVTPERHGSRRWLRPADLSFAADRAVIPLVGRELPKAAVSLPVGFVWQEERFQLVALVGLQPGQNLYVTPQGRWAGPYVPAVIRSHPFRLLASSEGKTILGVDEASELIIDGGSDGEPFFDEAGKPAAKLQAMIDFLTALRRDEQRTHVALNALAHHGLIQPWPLKVKAADGEQVVEGLYRIDEKALNALPAEALAEVRDAGGLNIAYCQMLSIQHTATLAKLVRLHQQSAGKAPMSLDELFEEGDDDFTFDFDS